MGHGKNKVLVALSGGVDSSVSVALLKEQGYDVEGAFIVTWTAPWLPCTWREERLDAMRVAATLGIRFHTIDLSKEYEQDVVQYMVREYRAGRTPNPDVMCNKHIKFGAFFEWAMGQGYDHVATGHYARVERCQVPAYSLQESGTISDVGGATCHLQAETCKLLCGRDTQKDQSYFLYTLTQRHLAHTLFPVGEYEKTQVRAMAKKFGLPTAQKKDSQGVCFLGQIDMKDFLQHYLPKTPGDVLDSAGTLIGRHDGATFYTLGQRHGFEVTAQSPNTEPLYVVAKDVTRNTITVAPRVDDTSKRVAQSVYLTDINWINRVPESCQLSAVSLQGRFRYRQPLVPMTIDTEETGNIRVTFGEPQAYVPTGQSLVLYDGDECLGGGVIERVV